MPGSACVVLHLELMDAQAAFFLHLRCGAKHTEYFLIDIQKLIARLGNRL